MTSGLQRADTEGAQGQVGEVVQTAALSLT